MEFLKILWDNLKKGPVTDAFPFGETYTPDVLSACFGNAVQGRLILCQNLGVFAAHHP